MTGAKPRPRFVSDDLRDELLAILPEECWVTRTSGLRCTEFIGGTFPNGTSFTSDLCCLPCRVRDVLDRIHPATDLGTAP